MGDTIMKQVTQEFLTKAETYIASHRDEIIEQLFSLVRVASVRDTAATDAPYGIMCRKGLDIAADLFRNSGYPTEVRSEGRYAIANMNGYDADKKTIGIFAHTDVVPAGNDWTVTQPFEPVCIDNVMCGRGIDDNKAAVVLSLWCANLLNALDIKLKSNFITFLGANEESGMDDVKHFVAEEKMPELCLVPDSSFPVVTGEKSICRFDAVYKDSFDDVLLLEGGKAYNAVPDRMTAVFKYSEALETALKTVCTANPKLSVTRGTFDGKNTLLFTAVGKAAHACCPYGAVNAIYMETSVLQDCPALTEHDRSIFAAMSSIISDYEGKCIGIDFTDPCFGRISYTNSICRMKDGCPVLSYDIRYGTSVTTDEYGERICSALGERGWAVENMNNRGGYAHKENDPYIDLITCVYATISGDTENKPFLSGGGTYSRVLKPNSYSIGQKSRLLNKKPPMTGGHGGVHQSDEMLHVDALLDAIKIVTALIIEADANL